MEPDSKDQLHVPSAPHVSPLPPIVAKQQPADPDAHAAPSPTSPTGAAAIHMPYWRQKIKYSTWIINVVYGLNWANLTVMQSLFPFLEKNLNMGATERGLLVTLRVFAMFLSLPLWGWLGDRYYSRRTLFTFGVFAWSVMTLCHLPATTFASLSVVSVLTGTFMGVVTPVARSLTSNYYEVDVRGVYFGYLELWAGIGGAVGVLLGALIGGIEGDAVGALSTFQVVFLILGMLTAPFSILCWWFCLDPIHDKVVTENLPEHQAEEVFPGLKGMDAKVEFKDLKDILRSRTWICIVVQGVLGSIPWTGLGYMINWFQVMKVPNILASLLFLLIAGGAAIGGLAGGKIGDYAYTRSKKYGRIFVGQVSVAIGVPLVALLLLAIPRNPDLWWVFMIVGFTFGCLITWPPPNNSVLLGDVVTPHLFGTAFSIQYMIEGGLGAWGTALVGVFAENVFGVTNLSDNTGQSIGDDALKNWLNGLAYALLVVCAIPWTLCAMCYFPMYHYYPLESRSLKRQASVEQPNDIHLSERA